MALAIAALNKSLQIEPLITDEKRLRYEGRAGGGEVGLGRGWRMRGRAERSGSHHGVREISDKSDGIKALLLYDKVSRVRCVRCPWHGAAKVTCV